MPYEIKHKSRNECLIRYVKGDDPDTKVKLNLPIIGFALVAVFMGLDFYFAILAVFLLIYAVDKAQPPRLNFEIELNRPNNRIIIRNSKQAQPKNMIYPLNHLMGFGLSEASAPKGSKHGAYTELHFEFDEMAKTQIKTHDVTLLSRAIKKETRDGRVFWQTPIRSKSYAVPLENGVDILESANDWLGAFENIAEDVQTPDTEVRSETAEIMRDFRDMDSGD